MRDFRRHKAAARQELIPFRALKAAQHNEGGMASGRVITGPVIK